MATTRFPKRPAMPKRRPPGEAPGPPMLILRDTTRVKQPTSAEIEQMKLAEKRRRRDVI